MRSADARDAGKDEDQPVWPIRSLALTIVIAGCSSPQSASPPPPSESAASSPSALASATPPPPAARTPDPTNTPSGSPTRSPIPQPTSAGVIAPGRDLVWVIVGGERLFRSYDRGETWEERPLPQDLGARSVTFVNDREGWVLSAGSPGTQCQFQPAWLWYTSDAGESWTRRELPGVSGNQCKTSVAFADRRRGYVVAGSPNHGPVVYRTDDGGLSWVPSQPFPDPPGFLTRNAGFTLLLGMVRPFGGTLLVDATGIDLAGTPRRYVFRSTQGGAIWTHAGTLPNPAGSVGFLSATRWLHQFAPSQLQETTDGGSSWHDYPSNYSQAAPIAPAFVFGDPLVGYASVRGSIKRTVDGGTTWTPLHTPGT